MCRKWQKDAHHSPTPYPNPRPTHRHVGLFDDEVKAAREADSARAANGMAPRNQALLARAEEALRSAAASNAPRRGPRLRAAVASSGVAPAGASAARARGGTRSLSGGKRSSAQFGAAAAMLSLCSGGSPETALAGRGAKTSSPSPPATAPSKNPTSRFRGVSWNNSNKKWMARIAHKRKKVYVHLVMMC